MKHVCELVSTSASQAATMFSNINATKDRPRDTPEVAPAAVRRSAWPMPTDLSVGRGHRMAYRTVGNPQGEPWLLVHGGPGSSCQPGMLAPLDLARQWVIAPDQRGCGASRPRGKTAASTTQALVADLEALRRHLGVDCWSLLAGSWGTVVALAYAQAHPERVRRLVLRGAFALSRREVGGLLQPSRQVQQTLGREAAWPAASGVSLPATLARLRQLLQSGTPGVAGLRVLRRWALLESACVSHGMRRALRQAMTQAPAARAAAIRRDWAALRRRQRKAQASRHRIATHPSDRAGLRKFRIQAHYLQHRGFVRPGALDCAVLGLARLGIPVDWVHGACDAVCPPANSRTWAAMGRRLAPQRVTLTEPLSGHLGAEPGMLAALRAVVRRHG
ncbi:MAG: prolyl aminopeptidase [Betaproteobacteria bacterium HGW-Betaproteobacteria-16]|nr:MAG: prolyl aminopeptidase [Betaproteobacteria bacterium HGW-Betaproteobacteria-16]